MTLVSALSLLLFHTSSYLIVSPAEYVWRGNRYSNGAVAWVISEGEMRGRLEGSRMLRALKRKLA